jgi:hypothetical protein
VRETSRAVDGIIRGLRKAQPAPWAMLAVID